MLRVFGHTVATCCDMLGVVGSNSKMVKFSRNIWGWPARHAHNLIFNSHHVAVCRIRVAKRTQYVATNNVALKCCDRLAGLCKYWAHNVAICCFELLRSFSWGLRLPYWPLIGKGYIQCTKPIKTASNKWSWRHTCVRVTVLVLHLIGWQSGASFKPIN